MNTILTAVLVGVVVGIGYRERSALYLLFLSAYARLTNWKR